MRTLKLGTRGPDVAAWQTFLQSRGFGIKADGDFGPRTEAATKAFQASEGLKADGIAGKLTLGRAGTDGHKTLRRLGDSDLTPAIIAEAVRILALHKRDPYGTEIPTTIDGEQFVARIEEHFHPPGGKRKPWGYHAGVSMFAVIGADQEDVEDEPPDEDADTIPVPPPETEEPTGFRLGATSRKRLEGVHPDLVRVIERAMEITPTDFTVIEGLRTMARQQQLVARGASRTTKSRHLTGHAVDLAPYDDGKLSFQWPDFYPLAATIKRAAAELDVAIVWGGVWDRELSAIGDPQTAVAEYVQRRNGLGDGNVFIDGPHFELARRVYS